MKLLIEYEQVRLDISNSVLEKSLSMELIGPIFTGNDIPAYLNFSVIDHDNSAVAGTIAVVLNTIQDKETVKLVLLSDEDKPKVLFRGIMTKRDKMLLRKLSPMDNKFNILDWKTKGVADLTK